MSAMAAAESRFVRRIAGSSLFVSEPNPSWFGNPGNENSLAWTNKNWLKSRFHFSFAEYNDPKRSGFGAMRVMNDDLVQPKRGFGEHPHRDAEICTYIVEGDLTHKDSMANAETLSRGAVQFMTAGSGVSHSEKNLSENPLRFIQMWFTPRARGLKPAYGSFVGDEAARKNSLAHIVSDVNSAAVKTPVKINQDVNIYVAEMDPGLSLSFTVETSRMVYFLCMEGDVALTPAAEESLTLTRHDAAHLYEAVFTISNTDSTSKNHIMIVEMAKN